MDNIYIVFIEYENNIEAKISPIKYSLKNTINTLIKNINSNYIYYYDNSNIKTFKKEDKEDKEKLFELLDNKTNELKINELKINSLSLVPVISFIIITNSNYNYVINCNTISDKLTKSIDKNIKNLISNLIFLISKNKKEKSRGNSPIVLQTKPVTPVTPVTPVIPATPATPVIPATPATPATPVTPVSNRPKVRLRISELNSA